MATDANSDTSKPAKPLRPAKDVEEKMQPLSRDAFKNLLKRAITAPASKPHPKST